MYMYGMCRTQFQLIKEIKRIKIFDFFDFFDFLINLEVPHTSYLNEGQ